VRGWSAFDAAHHTLLSGRSHSALPGVLRALGLDPLRCGLLLLDRISRAAVRPLRRRSTREPKPQFYDVDPAAPMPPNGYAAAPFRNLIGALEMRRMKALRRDDVRRSHS
jgi:hypothetical protein